MYPIKKAIFHPYSRDIKRKIVGSWSERGSLISELNILMHSMR